MSIRNMSNDEIESLLQTSVLDDGRKNKYAEVMTPLFLVEEILDQIPYSWNRTFFLDPLFAITKGIGQTNSG